MEKSKSNNKLLDIATSRSSSDREESSTSASDNGNKLKLNPFAKKTEDFSEENIYEYYSGNVLPAIWSSLPVLMSKIGQDTKDLVKVGGSKFIHFLLPKHWAESVEDREWPGFSQVWEQNKNSTFQEFLLNHL